jgi:hypothetical protein
MHGETRWREQVFPFGAGSGRVEGRVLKQPYEFARFAGGNGGSAFRHGHAGGLVSNEAA